MFEIKYINKISYRKIAEYMVSKIVVLFQTLIVAELIKGISPFYAAFLFILLFT
jgi:hypothetical protein